MAPRDGSSDTVSDGGGSGTNVFLATRPAYAGDTDLDPYGRGRGRGAESRRSGDDAEGKSMRSWLGARAFSRLFADPLRVFADPDHARGGDNMPSRICWSPRSFAADRRRADPGRRAGSTAPRNRAGDKGSERFTYYHVELADHSLILAENTPAESLSTMSPHGLRQLGRA